MHAVFYCLVSFEIMLEVKWLKIIDMISADLRMGHLQLLKQCTAKCLVFSVACFTCQHAEQMKQTMLSFSLFCAITGNLFPI